MTASTTPLELLTVSEASRRIGCVRNTLARKIERNGVLPDAILIEGGNQLRSPLFVEPRLKELTRLVESKTH